MAWLTGEAIVKGSIIALVAVVSIIGALGAAMSTRSSEGGRPAAASTSTAPPAPDRPSEPRQIVAARPSPVEAPKASPELQPQQAPVPLAARPRQAAKPADADAPETPVSGESGAAASSVTPGQGDESAARAAIEADGYKGVRILSKGDGIWRAKALRGKTEVLLIVDSNGSVTTAD